MALKALIEKDLAGVADWDIDGDAGRQSSYEITVDGTLLYSKLGKGSFPNNNAILEALKTYAEGGALKPM